MTSLRDLQRRALEVREKYARLNTDRDRQTWDGKAFTMGFVGDVGDLMKLVMAKENYRTLAGVDDIDAKLRHELSDCLWSILTIAHTYDVDLEAAFLETMNELDTRIAGCQTMKHVRQLS